jgi:hypothetical protein
MVDSLITEDFWNIDSLVQETFSLSREQGDLKDSFWQDELDERGDQVDEESFPSSPGIIFKLEKGISTFCIRGFPCHDIEESYLGVVSGRACELAEVLRFDLSVDSDDVLQFYATDNFGTAESVCEMLVNRRFPVMEDSIYNLSDPGLSWWMKEDAKGFHIYFNSHVADRELVLTKLGPMGDKLIANHLFGRFHSELQDLFVLKDFAVSEMGLRVEPLDPMSEGYQMFKSIFTEGQVLDTTLSKTFSIYLDELSHKRSFWLKVERLLDQKATLN